MNIVYLIAMKSKDENTHVGAVVVNPNNEIITMGYNGLVRGINDDVPERQEKPEKYFWFEHAERNAIYNAARIGALLVGCKMYTNGITCVYCARGVIQSGIMEVIVDIECDSGNEGKCKERADRGRSMLEEAGVKIRRVDVKLLEISKFRHGKIIN